MISNILSVGSKAEISHGLKKDPYKSKIMDILDEETLKLSLPIEGNLVIPLEKGWRLELTFWCKKGMYQCSGEVLSRYKEDNLYLMTVRITSELERIQRRQFYRLPYFMEIEFMEQKEEEDTSQETEEEVWNTGTTIDLSGGGCKFHSKFQYVQGTQLKIRFDIKMASGEYEHVWSGKVTSSSALSDQPDIFETRVEFLDAERRKREQLVKFIFEEERRIRRKERGKSSEKENFNS